MAKYDRLTEWLQKPKLPLTFAEIEQIIGDKLPPAASQYRPWWGNETKAASRQCRAWLDAGWQIDSVDLKAKRVVFRKV
ncbi:MAG: hypothetical protein WA738_21515 [Candidatus Angelobacter sp.]